MTINDTLSKIDKIFEDGSTPLATVPTEPVASGMMASVTGKLGGIWGDPKYNKFSNLSEEETIKLVGEDNVKITNNAKKIKAELDRAQSSSSNNIEDLKSAGVKSERVVAIITPDVGTNKAVPHTEFIKTAKLILDALLYWSAELRGKGGATALVKNVKASIREKSNLPEKEIHKIIAILASDDSVMSGFIETAGKRGIEAAATELERGVK